MKYLDEKKLSSEDGKLFKRQYQQLPAGKNVVYSQNWLPERCQPWEKEIQKNF
jgi:hypothetical protein